MQDLFGSLGGLLALFIILFIIGMPAGMVLAVRAFERRKAAARAAGHVFPEDAGAGNDGPN